MNTRSMVSSSRQAWRLLIFVWAALLVGAMGAKAEPVKTLVQDTLYRADGSAAHGTIAIRWNGFSTSAEEAVAAGEMTFTTDASGGIAIPLIANTGSSPSGSYYKVVIKLDDGTTSEEQWVVPATATATVAAIRAKVVPQAVAAQFVSRDYVDSLVGSLSSSSTLHLSGAESISGTKTFLVSPEVPVPSDVGGAANKGYVDQQMSAQAAVNLASPGAIGSITPSTMNATTIAASGTVAAGTTVSARDSITSTTPVVDLRAFGAKCDNATDDTAALQAAVTSIATTGGKILIPGIGATPCYFASPAGINWGNRYHVITLVIQGGIRTGTTFVQNGNVDLVGDSGGGVAQFQGAGSIASFTPPTNTFTLGTNVSAGTQTFTPSSTAGMAVGGGLTIVGNTTCAINSVSNAANLVTAQMGGACHIPPGYNMVVAGVTNTTFNGTWLVSQADYVANTLTWYCTTCGASSSGGSVTGPNEDTIESVVITAISGGNVTAYFSNAHNSSDAGGIVGLLIAGNNHHMVQGISVGGASGVGILIGGLFADNVHLRDVSAGCGPYLVTCQAIEIDNAIDVYLDHTVAMVSEGYGSWGLRLTNPANIVGTTGGTALVTIRDSWIRGGIKADHLTIFSNITVRDSISEETRRGTFTIQPNASGTGNPGTVYSVLLDNFFLQDNFNHYALSSVYYTQPLGIGSQITIKNNSSGLGAGSYSLVNRYFDGNLRADASLGSANSLPTVFGGRLPAISRTDPSGEDIELRGEGANLSPSVIPFATQAVPTSPASWSGTNCSVTTGVLAPDGSATAGTIGQTGGSNPQISLFSYSATTAVVGDYILYGGWTKSATATGIIGGVFGLINSYQQQILFDGAPLGASGSFDEFYNGDEWHPVVALNQITSVPSSGLVSHPTLYASCGSASVWMPFMIYVPASANISQQELMRWRKQLLHGVVPPGLPGGVLGMNSSHKLYWGSDTNLYRNGAGVLQTDGILNAVGGLQVNGVTVGAGNISGPGSSVVNDIVGFNSTDGKVLKDTGVAISSLNVAPIVLDFKTSSGPTGATGSNPWTYTLPTTAHILTVYVVSGGGGGGSGGVAATSGNTFGGGGGSGACVQVYTVPASYFGGAGAAITVGVGAGGNGGVAVSGSGTAATGNSGANGGQSYIAGLNSVMINASFNGSGSNGGTGGSTASAVGGSATTMCNYNGSVGSGGSLTTSAATQDATAPKGGAGGAGGGGISGNGAVASAGGAQSSGPSVQVYRMATPSNLAGGIAPGGSGQTPTITTSEVMIFGALGGTGGASSTAGNGGAGGAGMFPGGGGAGGGASVPGFSSGAGGAGGNGIVRIIVQ